MLSVSPITTAPSKSLYRWITPPNRQSSKYVTMVTAFRHRSETKSSSVFGEQTPHAPEKPEEAGSAWQLFLLSLPRTVEPSTLSKPRAEEQPSASCSLSQQ